MIFKTDFSDFKVFTRGKVRDVYDFDDKLLVVATDRISAFDVVMNTPIDDKGEILTQMSLFWFEFLSDIIINHLITAEVNKYPENCLKYKELLEGRSMLVKKTKSLPVECIVRGYISGSGWKDYKKSGKVCGIALKEGLTESDKLIEPIFTPSTKAEKGMHDENIDFNTLINKIGKELAERLRDTSINLYKKAADYALTKGIIIADTKFEFGLDGDILTLIDEVLTPDSSRFWPFDGYLPGKSQPSFDKQFLRDYLESLNWDKNPPAPELPVDIVQKTRETYLDALNLLTK
jgi:phosphoribosylaminoimidazole-succinocarboxamide synthase